MTVVHRARFDELDTATLYALLRLRVDTFVVEQACAYPELDGRDLEPDACHWWVDEGGAVVAYLRQLAESDGTARIGRVATAPQARGRGLSTLLLQAVVDQTPSPLVLDAQAHLVSWYQRFGFVISGPGFVEDGIPHLPMRREPTAARPGVR
ncbi:MAG: GNAT family N-acetyltransferase [Actinomycetota bacterium]|nr:GNAT family N-acetyltransferase [Actinomycetota bacterium]